jgi:exopolysaccharide biosynthesis polyprenyl glycosylphosphotransferase
VRVFNTESGSSLPSAFKATRAQPLRESSRHKSVQGFQGIVKRCLDISVASVALVLLSPLFAVIGLLVRITDGGAVLYRQTRVGLEGRRFTMIKFRTMREDAERDLGPVWSVPRDPRCTTPGYLLRRLGLDELPQLWNVLRGEMSLVGPRPERPEFIRQFRKEYEEYDQRHMVRSGLTGYAQIHGWRGFTSLEERLRHDTYYLRNWSLRLDLYIILMTLLRGWSERTRTGV